jgi:hypothetical protein
VRSVARRLTQSSYAGVAGDAEGPYGPRPAYDAERWRGLLRRGARPSPDGGRDEVVVELAAEGEGRDQNHDDARAAAS